MPTNFFVSPVFTEYVPATGEPAANYQLEFWENNSRSASQAVYDDADIGGVASPITQPIVLNANGRPPGDAPIWLDPDLVYAVTLKTPSADGSVIVWESDDISTNTIDSSGLSVDTLRLTSTGLPTVSSTTHALQLGPSNSFNLRMGVNIIQAVNNGTASALALNPEGGDVSVGDPSGYHIEFDTDGTANILSLNNATPVPLQINGEDVVTETSGTFSAAMQGGADAPTMTVNWLLRGDTVILQFEGATENTPNSNIFQMTGTPLPAGLRPSTDAWAPITVVEGGINRPGAVQIRSTGAVIFLIYITGTDRYQSSGWTTSGASSKAINATTVSYIKI